MAPKYIAVAVLAALASAAAAEMPNDVKDCLRKCPTDANPSDCVIKCTGISQDVMEKYNKCGQDCLSGDMSDSAKVMECTSGCVGDLQKELDYPVKDLIGSMTDESTAEAVSAMLESSKNSTSSNKDNDDKKDADKDSKSDSENNGASTIATFTSSFGLCAAALVYQLS